MPVGDIVAASVFGAFWLVSVALFLHRRNREPIRSRQWHLTMVSALYAMFFFIILAAENVDYVSRADDPLCHLLNWTGAFLIPLWIYPVFLRAYVLYFQFYRSQRIIHGLQDSTTNWFMRFRFSRTKRAMLLVLAVVVVLTIIVYAGIDFGAYVPEGSASGTVGTCDQNAAYLYLAQAAVSLFLLVFFVVSLWSVDDIFGFKFELKLLCICEVPLLIFWAVLEFQNEPLGPTFFSTHVIMISLYVSQIITICIPIIWTYREETRVKDSFGKGRYAWETPEVLQALGLLPVPASIPSQLPQSTFYTHLQTPARKPSATDALRTEPEQFLRAALRNPILLASIEKFALQSWCVENIIFWLDLQTLRADIMSAAGHGPNAHQQMKRIYNTYIDAHSDMQLNLDDNVRQTIKQAIARLDSDATAVPSTDVFEEAEKLVIHQIAADTLRKWHSTPMCTEALQALTDRSMTRSISDSDLTVDEMRARVVIAQHRKASEASIELVPRGGHLLDPSDASSPTSPTAASSQSLLRLQSVPEHVDF